MKRSKFSEEQVAYALRQADAGTAGDVRRQLGISEATFHVWKERYGHPGVHEVRRVCRLEDEHERLKRLVADLTRGSRDRSSGRVVTLSPPSGAVGRVEGGSRIRRSPHPRPSGSGLRGARDSAAQLRTMGL